MNVQAAKSHHAPVVLRMCLAIMPVPPNHLPLLHGVSHAKMSHFLDDTVMWPSDSLRRRRFRECVEAMHACHANHAARVGGDSTSNSSCICVSHAYLEAEPSYCPCGPKIAAQVSKEFAKTLTEHEFSQLLQFLKSSRPPTNKQHLRQMLQDRVQKFHSSEVLISGRETDRLGYPGRSRRCRSRSNPAYTE
jgi:hypothetical protein